MAEAAIGDSAYEVLGVRGYHTVHFENGSCIGTTQAGIPQNITRELPV